ncbi:uracil-xanthine permease family protein [Desulfolucanica intricata]|uniref:uracil-xanthine permease family protein n=1 Tax=Desulfolucanica intricata TaxID=1285191 RepID=UPI000836CBE6|nr:purine/pyrimidine permease [Desulfolucanica intricata]
MEKEQQGAANKLLYGLREAPPLNRTLVYSIQWLAFTLANSAVVPLVVGNALGLDQAGIASLAQRTFFFSALASLLQVYFGHRLPIMEGPAGMWWGIFITLSVMAPGLGKSLAVLRTDLEMGLIIAGAVLFVVGSSRLIGSALRLFTPAVTGSVLILLGLQLSGTFVKGMLGIGLEGPGISLKATFVSIIVVAVVFLVTLKTGGFIRSIAILIGVTVGWILAALLGIAGDVQWADGAAFFALPQLFAWGKPTFDLGIVITSVFTGLLVLSNLVASILAMDRTIDEEVNRRDYDRGVAFTGVADIMAGVGSTVGFVPYSAAAGLVGLTRVASRVPFVVFTVAMMILGLIPSVGAFLSSIPAPVGYSVLLASFCQMIGFGLKDYSRLEFDTRNSFVIGLPILVGTGIMFLPPEVFEELPSVLRYILGNGFITGMIMVILLEHLFIPAGKNKIDAQR